MNQLLERVSPEQVGIAPAGIRHFLGNIEDKNINLHSFMLLRYGKVAAEGYYKPFDAHRLHPIFSVSKSVTSAAVGIAIGEGLFSLEDRVIDFFPDKLSGDVHPFTAMMKVRHLLSMQTVHPSSTKTDVDDWVYPFLNTPPSHPPGTVFAYDTTGTHTLCAIIQRTSGQTVHDYLRTRLFDPIGIGPIEWESDPMGINKGGSGIKCRTEDMARFGQLYVQDGVWEGKRILPEGWVEQSTGKIVDTSNAKMLLDGRKGYGYQFWRSRFHSYCAFGMGGQFIVIVPDKQLVFVTTANTLQNRDEHQLILDCFWESLYTAVTDDTLSLDPHEGERLTAHLGRLQLVLPEGRTESDISAAGTNLKYELYENPLGYDVCELRWEPVPSLIFYAEQQQKAVCPFALGRPKLGEDPFFALPSAAAAIWVDDRTIVLQIQLLDPLQMFILTCRLEERLLLLQIKPIGVLKTGRFDCELIGSR